MRLLAVLLALALCRIGPASADDGKEVPTVCKELGKDKHAKAKHAKKTDDEDDDEMTTTRAFASTSPAPAPS